MYSCNTNTHKHTHAGVHEENTKLDVLKTRSFVVGPPFSKLKQCFYLMHRNTTSTTTQVLSDEGLAVSQGGFLAGCGQMSLKQVHLKELEFQQLGLCILVF